MKDVIQALVVEDDPIVQLGLSSLIGSISYICCERCITRQAFSEYPTDDFGQTIVILKSLSTAVQDLIISEKSIVNFPMLDAYCSAIIGMFSTSIACFKLAY
jgi:hypothetical protein